jgi:SAM-dependent methyltransferase
VRARYNRTGAPPADGGTAPGREEDYLAYEQAHEGPFLRLQEQALGDAGFFELEGRIMAAARDGGPPADPDRPPMPDRPAALDIGCATGAMLTLLKSRGWDARGVEISRPQAAYCRSRGLDAAALPLEECRFPAGRFDAVLASHVIEHVNDPASFVREARRILKPRGRFYVTTPNIAGLQARLFGGRWRSAIFDHLYLFSVRTLGALLKKEGFTVERVRTWGGLAAGIGPGPVKRVLDSLAKPLGFGDVMIVRAVRD